MTKSKNKFGLSRYIPESIKRKIRQDAGFGCVVCGAVPYEYEHIEPLWSEARDHNPEYMTLLCGGCHSRVTRGFLSKETVWKAKRNPKCFEKGYSNVYLDFSGQIPDIKIGEVIFVDCKTPLRVAGRPVITSRIADHNSDQIYISGYFYDSAENEIGRIIDNEWQGSSANEDIETIGNRIIVKKRGGVAFEFSLEPPNLITIKTLNMAYRNNQVAIYKDVDGKPQDLLLMGANHDDGSPGVCFQMPPGKLIGLESVDLDKSMTLQEKSGQDLVYVPINGKPKTLIHAAKRKPTRAKPLGFG